MERATQNVGQSGSSGTEPGAELSRRPAGQAPGLAYARVFAQAGRDPFDAVEWERRDAVISNDRGESVFEQRGVEVPRFWSQQATNIVVSKYFRGAAWAPQARRLDRQPLVKRRVLPPSASSGPRVPETAQHPRDRLPFCITFDFS
jgi:RES domain-containing protein